MPHNDVIMAIVWATSSQPGQHDGRSSRSNVQCGCGAAVLAPGALHNGQDRRGPKALLCF